MLLEDMGRRHAGEWLQRLGELQPLGLKRGTARRLAVRRELRRDSSRDGQRKQVVQSPRSRQIADRDFGSFNVFTPFDQP